jgi:hypothetical protein
MWNGSKKTIRELCQKSWIIAMKTLPRKGLVSCHNATQESNCDERRAMITYMESRSRQA